MKIGIVIQARTSSSRLPEKVLLPLPYHSNKRVIEQVVKRCGQVSNIDQIIIATTTDKSDNPIVNFAASQKIIYYRGSLENVLDRYYQTAIKFQLDHIVRITSDCPCIDPGIIHHVVRKHLNQDADYTSNAFKRTFPVGQDVEVIKFTALQKAFQEANKPFEKEHVTPYFYQSNPQSFKIQLIEAANHQNYPELRLTLDTKADYHLLCAIYDFLYLSNHFFSLDDIINLMQEKPWMKELNSQIVHKKIHNDLASEISEGIEFAEKQSLERLKKFLSDKLTEM